MRNFLIVTIFVLLLAGCSKRDSGPAGEATFTLEVARPAQGVSMTYTLPVGDSTAQEIQARQSRLLQKYDEAVMYDVLAQTTGFADIRDKSEIEQSDAIDTEYKISLSALLGRTDEDHFLLPDSAGTVATAITAKFFTLRRVAIRPKADLAGEEQAQIKAALESINVYYLCSGGKGKQRIIACFVGKDDAVLRKAAMEIVITYGRLGAVISRKSSQEAR